MAYVVCSISYTRTVSTDSSISNSGISNTSVRAHVHIRDVRGPIHIRFAGL